MMQSELLRYLVNVCPVGLGCRNPSHHTGCALNNSTLKADKVLNMKAVIYSQVLMHLSNRRYLMNYLLINKSLRFSFLAIINYLYTKSQDI